MTREDCIEAAKLLYLIGVNDVDTLEAQIDWVLSPDWVDPEKHGSVPTWVLRDLDRAQTFEQKAQITRDYFGVIA